jgi:hypothetical protein
MPTTAEKLDLLGLDEGFDFPHGAFAAGALEGIGSPGGEDKVAPKGPHGLGACGGWWDEERVGFRWRLRGFFVRGFFFLWGRDDLGGMCSMTAARKVVAGKTSKLRLVFQLRRER